MRLRVVSVGQRMPRWVQDAWQEYVRRMPRELTVELTEVAPARLGRHADTATTRRTEGLALRAAIPEGYRVIALDGRGTAWSTEELAGRMQVWMGLGQHCAFLVGGAEGLDEPCLETAEERWSLGPLTLPHPLVRVLLAEQLYRAWTIIARHPYHRA